jgi:hypothetical protein
VLRQVGLVQVRRDGRRTLCRLEADGLRPLHEWTETFERFWQHQLTRVKERAERQSRTGGRQLGDTSHKKKETRR